MAGNIIKMPLHHFRIISFVFTALFLPGGIPRNRAMNALTYRDFIGSVSFSSEDEVFYGKIEHINDLITFESYNAHDIKQAFEEAVDDYITFCQEKGVKPNKPFKGSFNVRVKPSVHKLAYLKAIQQGMSLNKFIETTLEKELKE